MNPLNWLVGYRTYIIAFITALLPAVSAAGIPIPPWVQALLTAGGLVTARLAAGRKP